MVVSRFRLLLAVVALPLLAVAILLSAAQAVVAEGPEEGFVPIFNGTSLEGWEGRPEFWRVEDGSIVGETTAETPTKANTFLIWRQGELDDFDLRLEFRLRNHNSGVQYRSRDLGDFSVGGYQADIAESSAPYCGIIYEERGRGILAKRGEKITLTAEGGRQPAAAIGTADDLGKAIRPGEWNDYRILARGNRLQQFINGQLMSEIVDEQASKRAMQGVLALQLHAGPPMQVAFRKIRLRRLRLADGRKKLVLVAGRPSHRSGEHEFRAGSLLMAKCLRENVPQIVPAVYDNGWPADPTAFDNADAILFFADGGGRHPVVQRNRLAEIAALAARGVGIAALHYAVEVPKEKGGEAFLAMLGGYFETHWSVNPHWTLADTRLAEGHPIARGVQPFEITDEWYYHMRFREPADGLTEILTAVPPDSTRERPDGPHSNNPTVRAGKGNRETLAWAYERPDGGRGFGCTGGHFHANFGNDDFRRMMLNALLWVTGLEVPAGGVESSLTPQELQANLDDKKKR